MIAPVTRRFASMLVICIISAALVQCSGGDPHGDEPSRAPAATTEFRPAAVVQGLALSTAPYFESRDQTVATYDLAQRTSLRSIRLPIAWGLVQPVDAGAYDWGVTDRIVDDAVARGLSIVASIASTPAWAAAPGSSGPYAEPGDPQAFGRFVGAVAARYRGKITAYEMWNEPNGALFYNPTPDPVSYTALLRAGYRAVKAVDPALPVIAGSLGAVVDSPSTRDPVAFLRSMYAAGAGGNFDALSFHPYKNDLSLSAAWLLRDSPGQQLTAIRKLMIANGDDRKKIWATEYGVPTSTVTEARQNEMLTDFAEKWRELPYAGPVFYFTDRDLATGDGDPENNFGLLRTDRSPKPALATLAGFARDGVPDTPEFTRFQREPVETSLGEIVSPVVPIANTGRFLRMHLNGAVYETPVGFISAPAPVVARIAEFGTYPRTPLVAGRQDLANGLRVYYSPQTGAHVAGDGITSVWTPNLGLAITDEVPQSSGGVMVTFEHGFITWSSDVGGVATLR
ncbi:cellulase family glycosylhydrolase [Williamsia sp.]|uniref:cellulase family glycosylhydrolase n=1 Tax=Williamsia sp. TaxID=1872085 RepID=UPI001A29FFA0|nr:cellulase family glycosylhydrolase [Williamsia sp.]MBJ7289142.1 hypothetical protein [Williamsia sp.]